MNIREDWATSGRKPLRAFGKNFKKRHAVSLLELSTGMLNGALSGAMAPQSLGFRE
jgi:hypothetical protein